MRTHDVGSNVALIDRFDEMQIGIETCKQHLDSLSISLTSFRHEALGDNSVRSSVPQQDRLAAVVSFRSDSRFSTVESLRGENGLARPCSPHNDGGEFNVQRPDSERSPRPKAKLSSLRAGEPSLSLESLPEASEVTPTMANYVESSIERLSVMDVKATGSHKRLVGTLSREGTLKIMKPRKAPTKYRANWPATLSVDWPHSLSSRYVEVGIDDRDGESHVRSAVDTMMEKTNNKSGRASHRTPLSSTERASMFVLTPTHPARLFLDICSIVCLLYDGITIPFFLAWDVEESHVVHYLQAAVMLFWTVDIAASFRTGYFYDGEVVTDSWKIAKRYLKGAFIFELAIVVVDWIDFIASMKVGVNLADTSKVLRFGRLSRVLRLMGVARLGKVSAAFHRILDRNVSTGIVLALELLELIIVIVFVNHILGCVWFAISKSYILTDTGSRWTDQQVGKGERFDETTRLFQYFSSLHWSMTQMTPGSMRIDASNSAERIFTVSCLLFGMLFFSALISTLSYKMMSMRMLHANRTTQLNVMMSFLRERHVGASMAFVIKREVKERMQLKEPLRQENVEALTLLSIKLQAELHMTICKPLLLTSPIFVVIFRLDKHLSSQICFHAFSFIPLKRYDILFSAGGDCNNAYVVSQGSLKYTQTPETSLVFHTESRRVDPGSWLCEASLWSEWIHVGIAECVDVVEILDVKAAQLMDITKKNLVLKNCVSHVGSAYHKYLISLVPPKIPNDLCGEMLDNSHILSTVESDCSLLISLVSFDILSETSGWRFNAKSTQPLIEEVRLGRSTLVPRSDTQVRRCVHVSCLKLFRDDGHMFVVLGTWDHSERKIKTNVKLPGTKMMGWENPELALVRFVKEDLGLFEQFIILETFEKAHIVQRSYTYGLLTDYTRNIFIGSVTGVPEFTNPQLLLSPLSEREPRPSMNSLGTSSSHWSNMKRNFAKSASRSRSRWRDFPCVTFRDQRHTHVYTWMLPERFEALAGTSNHSFAEQVMQDFDISEVIELGPDSVDRTHDEDELTLDNPGRKQDMDV